MSSSPYLPPDHGQITILHVSRGVLVVDKPAGLLTVPGRGVEKSDCLLSRVQLQFPQAMIVHRLDMATSGIVVMGLGSEYQRKLSLLFQERKLKKHYQAVIDGRWRSAPEGEIRLPLIADWPNRPRQKVDAVAGRPCLTRYRILDVEGTAEVSRIALSPVTGRTHQLRVHMESVGHPILGDALYGTDVSRSKANRLMLHACAIEFADPDVGTLIRAVSDPPF